MFQFHLLIIEKLYFFLLHAVLSQTNLKVIRLNPQDDNNKKLTQRLDGQSKAAV